MSVSFLNNCESILLCLVLKVLLLSVLLAKNMQHFIMIQQINIQKKPPKVSYEKRTPFLQNTFGRLLRIGGILLDQSFVSNWKSEEAQKCTQLLYFFGKLSRSSRPKVFCKKGVLRNFAKFTGKHLCQRLFFNKLY